jgi:hypothetical protein
MAALLLLTFAMVAAIAHGQPQSCCPNGPYIGDISEACSSTNPTLGDGQCYEGYVIQCKGGYADGTVLYQYDMSNDHGVGDCFNFCLNFGVDFTAASVAFSGNTICKCLSNPSQFKSDNFGVLFQSLLSCDGGPPTRFSLLPAIHG